MAAVIRTLLYVVAGFFLYIVDFLAYMKMPMVGADHPHNALAIKAVMFSFFLVPAVFLIVIAAATARFRDWQLPVGIVLLSSAGTTLFCLLMIICMVHSPNIMAVMQEMPTDFMSNYFSGGVVTLCFLGLGAFLVRRPSTQTSIQKDFLK